MCDMILCTCPLSNCVCNEAGLHVRRACTCACIAIGYCLSPHDQSGYPLVEDTVVNRAIMQIYVLHLYFVSCACCTALACLKLVYTCLLLLVPSARYVLIQPMLVSACIHTCTLRVLRCDTHIPALRCHRLVLRR